MSGPEHDYSSWVLSGLGWLAYRDHGIMPEASVPFSKLWGCRQERNNKNKLIKSPGSATAQVESATSAGRISAKRRSNKTLRVTRNPCCYVEYDLRDSFLATIGAELIGLQRV